MNINWNESSTRRGAVGLVIFVLCVLIILFDDDYAGKVAAMLSLGQGISAYMKFTLPDNSM